MSEYDHLLATCPRDMRLGKCPKGFELRMIEISCEGIINPYKADILAFVHEGLAIHKHPMGWSITHIRSGKSLTGTDTKRGAVKAVKQLANDFDWSQTEAMLRHITGCKAAVAAVRDD